jgi:hypothetical protein
MTAAEARAISDAVTPPEKPKPWVYLAIQAAATNGDRVAILKWSFDAQQVAFLHAQGYTVNQATGGQVQITW